MPRATLQEFLTHCESKLISWPPYCCLRYCRSHWCFPLTRGELNNSAILKLRRVLTNSAILKLVVCLFIAGHRLRHCRTNTPSSSSREECNTIGVSVFLLTSLSQIDRWLKVRNPTVIQELWDRRWGLQQRADIGTSCAMIGFNTMIGASTICVYQIFLEWSWRNSTMCLLRF